ncbi:MAG: hypothetical protein RL173_3317 [Fibrobacterota bacterium]|jgi:hypothetical protein
MRRQILIASLAVATLAPVVSAACTDSMFLQSITVYRQNLKNSAVLSTWDTVKVNPWDANSLLDAGPLGYLYSATPDTATHFLGFKYGCGADTGSKIQGVRVIDKRVRSGEDYSHQKSSETFTLDASVAMYDGDGAGLTYAGEHWSVLWNSSLFQIGKKASGTPRETYDQSAISYKYTSTTSGSSVLTSGAGTYPVVHPILADYEGVLSTFLTNVGFDVAKVGSGVDSVRTQVVRFRYEYDYVKPSTGVRDVAARAAFRVNAGANGWSILLPRAASLSIHSTDGKRVRQFPSARSVVWDGRDAAGAAVHPGVWLIRAEGVGSMALLVR